MSARSVLAIILGLALAAGAWTQGDEAGQESVRGMKVGLLFLNQEMQLLTQGVTTVNYQDVFSSLWRELGPENGIFVSESFSGWGTDESGNVGITKLLDDGVDAVVIYRLNPSVPVPSEDVLSELDVPIVWSGYHPEIEISDPYIGFSDEADGRALGKQAAEKFRGQEPEGQAKIVTVGIVDFRFSEDRIRGFIEGFRSVVPDAEVLEQVEILGEPAQSSQMVQAMHTKYPEVNVLFGAGETATLSIVSSLHAAKGENLDDLVIAGFAGSRDLVLGAGEDESRLTTDVLALLPFREIVERTVEVLKPMLLGAERQGGAKDYRLESRVVSDPSDQELTEYLDSNFIE